MKFALFAFGLVLGWYLTFIFYQLHSIQPAPYSNDPAKACRIVTHMNSDGEGWWSCEKNK